MVTLLINLKEIYSCLLIHRPIHRCFRAIVDKVVVRIVHIIREIGLVVVLIIIRIDLEFNDIG